jgi:predicted DNA-binding transcriptional regulator AlpA
MNYQEFDGRLERIEKLLGANKEILNLEDLCLFTGLSASYFYKQTSQGKIPHFVRAKHLWFDREEIIAWLKENRGFNELEANRQAINDVQTGKRGGGK